MSTFILFDIDGTIIEINYAGRTAFELSAIKVFGKGISLNAVSLKGTTDKAAFERLFILSKNDPASYENCWDLFKSSFAEILERIAPDFSWIVIPGFRDFINILREKKISFGFCTGNIIQGARLKMKASDLPF